MKNIFQAILILLLTGYLYPHVNLTKYVNPFIGTGGHGHTYPGASLPFGMVQLSPDTRLTGWDGCSGYHYSDSIIYGFSHTHLSGTGVPDYCDILIMPTTGFPGFSNIEYSSVFSHNNEFATAGYYTVFLDKYGIQAELTATKRAGFHRYTFPSEDNSGFIIDLLHRDEVTDSGIEFTGDNEIRGYRFSRGWAKNQMVFFVIRFSKPFERYGISEDGGEKQEIRSAVGTCIKGYAGFSTNAGEEILVKVGISGVSIEGALKNLESEIPDWDFDGTRKNADYEWNRELNKIIVESDNEDEKTVFYTALYHCLLNPNLYMDVDGKYRGTDLKIHTATGFENYTVFSLWDTYRALHPLLTIIETRRTVDFINTLIAQYENGGMFPVWELSGNETFCMIGYHSIPVIADAYAKGIRNYNVDKIFRYMHETSNRNIFGSDVFVSNGYISQDKEHESVSKTLEYAYDDWCIAEMAGLLNITGVSDAYNKRAQYYKNVFNPENGFMQAKMNGGFYEPFEPSEVNNNYTEANAWQYTFYVPHDISGLSELYGGKDKLAGRIEELFTTKEKMTGREQVDITGLIGQYAHGNEPSHHIAYIFDYFGKPHLTQYYVNKIMKEFYKNSPGGLIGNEDCGQMSAWYIFSAIGFYPVCPGNTQYAIGSPLFDKVTLNLENGNKFEIISGNHSSENFYISGSKLNGKEYNKYFIDHNDIIKGGKIEFQMSSSPITGNISVDYLPVSEIKGNDIVTVPYFSTSKNSFKDEMTIEIKSMDRDDKIHYTVTAMYEDEVVEFGIYEKPVKIDYSATIYALSVNKDGEKSSTVTGNYYKIPEYEVNLISKYNPQYSAGGPEGLIDGIRGNRNWRLGGWQGFQSQDFEVVIDLKQLRFVKNIRSGFLQDIRSWIWMPVKVYYYISEDGINFSETVLIINDIQNNDYYSDVIIKDFHSDVNKKARYIKVRAENFGKIPDWHPGSGGDAFIFIDEIVIDFN